MGLLLLGLLTYVMPGDTNIYGGMDVNIAQFSRYWEWVYERSTTAFRTSQGCLDHTGWYQLYELKTEAAFNKRFSLRYQFQMHRNYDDTLTEHRFEPTMMIVPNLYTHLAISPYYQKNYNELGAGISWRRGNTDWIAFYCMMQRFDHGFSLMYTLPGPTRDPFRKIPLKFELDARGERDWLRLRFHGELGTQADQYLDWPDSVQYLWEKKYDKSKAWGRIEIKPVERVWLGTRFEAMLERSEIRWADQGVVVFDTLRYFWAEPFISIWPTERLELRTEYRFLNISRDMDSVTYRNDTDVFSALASWQPLDFLLVEAGYQQSKRTRYNNDTTILEPWKGPAGYNQARLLFNLELRLESGMMLSIKEGIEMNDYPEYTFRSPHNHTYVLLHMPLAISEKK